MSGNKPLLPGKRIEELFPPWELFLAALFYFLGVGIHEYLGKSSQWNTLIIGFVTILMLLIAKSSLSLYLLRVKLGYSIQFDQNKLEKSDDWKSNKLQVLLSILVCITSLTTAVVLSFIMIKDGVLLFDNAVLLFLAYFFAIFIPLYQQNMVGYIELINTFLIIIIIPAFAFLLQGGELHRLVILLTLPISLLFIAEQIALSLKNYGDELKYGTRTLLGRLGWRQAMNLHNILILISYLFIAFETFFGLSWDIAWRLLLTLPLGLYQLWQILRIAAGGKPNWKLLDLNARATLGVTAYLAVLIMWIG
jgi:4-hydroxybenzoate polyprenyltransferase